MTISSNASPDSLRPARYQGLPLSTYTEQRLASMERFTSRLTNTESGFTETTLAQAAAVKSLGQLLVALLRERESRS